MTRKITRVSLTLPKDLLDELDEVLEAQDYSSRSEAIRDALRDFLTNYRWRKELKGKQLGAIMTIYEHDVPGLTDKLIYIQHEELETVGPVQHLHIDEKNCLETLIVRGEGEKIRKLIDHLESLRGVKQAKLVIVGK